MNVIFNNSHHKHQSRIISQIYLYIQPVAQNAALVYPASDDRLKN